MEEKKINDIMTFDTKYTPPLANNVELCREVKEPVKFIMVEFNAREQSGDPLISIVTDNEFNRAIIENLEGRIIGSGTSEIALPSLIYGLQHPTRLLYKDTIAGINEFVEKYLKDKFLDDDTVMRENLNTVQ